MSIDKTVSKETHYNYLERVEATINSKAMSGVINI